MDAGLFLVSGPRALAVAAMIIGLGACAIGGGRMTDQDRRSRYGRAMGAFAAVPGRAGLIAIITGSEVALAVLVGSIVAMWLAATIRHMVTGPSEIADADLQQMIEREHVDQRQS